ncbi:hypothetical protein LUW76_13745 [Actinomadura madurae]|uniref:hypothetical protein n=1 Tax=Actinomadura madurae TaxID=1993 RepID=UPI0020272038|nr:hypothetical protein [Actinomadura madurae]URM95292.1 hypothetical protein LUW76_13745 [Actinomadura madurae]
MSARDRELVLLGELYVALAKLGLDVQLRDAIPGLTVRAYGVRGQQVSGYVVLHGGTRFTWWRVDNTHPAEDITGAARRILDYLQSDSGQGAGS